MQNKQVQVGRTTTVKGPLLLFREFDGPQCKALEAKRIQFLFSTEETDGVKEFRFALQKVEANGREEPGFVVRVANLNMDEPLGPFATIEKQIAVGCTKTERGRIVRSRNTELYEDVKTDRMYAAIVASNKRPAQVLLETLDMLLLETIADYISETRLPYQSPSVHDREREARRGLDLLSKIVMVTRAAFKEYGEECHTVPLRS